MGRWWESSVSLDAPTAIVIWALLDLDGREVHPAVKGDGVKG
jgi:hypothetical protein